MNQTNYAELARDSWQELVRVCRQVGSKNLKKSARAIAEAAGVGPQSVLEKMQAIRFALDLGRSEEYVVSQGQKRIIEQYRETRSQQRLDPMTSMSWRVSEDTRNAVRAEVHRIMQILNIRDPDLFWTWWHSEASLWTPAQLRHSAGEPRLRRHAPRASETQREVERVSKGR